MKSKFALSFGLSLFLVGILNIFLETNKIILFGISISSMIFSLISIFSSFRNKDLKHEIIYVVPFALLLSIFCYSNSLTKYKIINDIINSKTLNILTFFSFGLLFVSEYINYKKDIKHAKSSNLKIINTTLEYNQSILDLIENYLKEVTGKEATGKDLNSKITELIDQLQNHCLEKLEESKIEINLIDLKKDNYSLEDFSKVYKESKKEIQKLIKKS